MLALTLIATACGSTADDVVDAAEDAVDEAADAVDGDDEEAMEDEAGEVSLVSDGTLTVCTDVPFPPMEFEDSETETGFNGFDIEIAGAIAADNGWDLAVVTPGWDAITSGLAMEAGDCDIAVSSITITEEREEGVDFSDPYFSAEQSLFVAADSDATGAGDLGTLAVQSGTTGEIYAQENFDNELLAFDDAGSLYLALESGDVDGVVTDQIGNQGYADENPGVGKVIATYDTQELYGMAVQEEGSEALLAAVNASLAKFNEDGTYQEIFDGWFSA